MLTTRASLGLTLIHALIFIFGLNYFDEQRLMQNRHQKVVHRGALHSNSTKIPLIYDFSYFNLGGLGALFGGLSTPKTPWRQDWVHVRLLTISSYRQ